MVLVTAATVRALVAFVALHSMPLVSDARSYSEAAIDIVSRFPGATAYYWPPGMPYLLAAGYSVLGRSLGAARLISLVVGVANVALVALLASRLLPERRHVLAAALIAALYPPAVLLASQTYSEELAALCLLGTTLAFLAGWEDRRAWLVAGGVALGAAILTRPSAVTVAIAFLVAAVIGLRRTASRGDHAIARRLGAGVALAILGSLGVLTPVLAFNVSKGAGVTISTNNERNLFLGNNPYTPLYKSSHLGQRTRQELPTDTQAYLARFEDRPDARQAMAREALRYIATHPAQSALRTFNRVQSFWGFDYVMSREIQKAYGFGNAKLLVVLTLEAGGYLVVAVAVLVGMTLGWRQVTAPGRSLIVLAVLAFEVPYALAFSVPIYHHPVVMMLLPFAAIGLSEVWERRFAVLRHRGLLLALVLFAAVQAVFALFAARYA